jgi:hypothetical protein
MSEETDRASQPPECENKSGLFIVLVFLIGIPILGVIYSLLNMQ